MDQARGGRSLKKEFGGKELLGEYLPIPPS